MIKGKTLAELDVKPGDVVYFHDPRFFRGKDRTIGTDMRTSSEDPHWHLVSRANEPDKPKWGPWIFTEGKPEYITPRGLVELAKSESGDVIAYRRLIEPVRETVTLMGNAGNGFDHSGWGSRDDTHRITFETIDGKPDCNSIRMETIGDE